MRKTGIRQSQTAPTSSSAISDSCATVLNTSTSSDSSCQLSHARSVLFAFLTSFRLLAEVMIDCKASNFNSLKSFKLEPSCVGRSLKLGETARSRRSSHATFARSERSSHMQSPCSPCSVSHLRRSEKDVGICYRIAVSSSFSGSLNAISRNCNFCTSLVFNTLSVRVSFISVCLCKPTQGQIGFNTDESRALRANLHARCALSTLCLTLLLCLFSSRPSRHKSFLTVHYHERFDPFMYISL